MPKKKEILVIDDEKKITDVVSAYLSKNGFEPVAGYCGRDALALFESHSVSLVILDLMLPDIPGETVARSIRRQSRVPIIMLTAKVEEESALAGFCCGADDYIRKPFSPRELMARVTALIRRSDGEALAEVVSADNGNLVIDNTAKLVRKNDKPVKLTPREFSILVTLAAHPGRVFSRDELSSFAFGDHFSGFDRTIDSHIKNLRAKIEDDIASPRYVVTVHGMGYRFDA
ncbi:MAG: response regulator transcription factor [Spirochaetales bacterium]|nr:MAG: response regulator transcription factor [Spirochaetales bacterium]